ncbi:MAG TPA: hypothetical protein VJ022_04785 [Anaerolineales bacterium]|nr:hypothetical protein [Anaerolineales bacterium]
MDNQMLVDKRKRVHARLEEYRSLPEYILDGVGAMLERVLNPAGVRKRNSFLPPHPTAQEDEDFPSYWWNGVVIFLITLLIGWLISVSLGLSFSPDETALVLWASGTGTLALIANKVNIRAFLKTFRESLLDKMLRDEDVDHLGNWLEINFGVWKPLLSGLVAGPLLAWLLYSSWLENHPLAVFQVGVFSVILLACIQSVWVGYYLLPFYVAFPSRLNRYQFDLYTTDPSSSEVVGRLSRLLTFILYVTLGFIMQLTVGLTLLGVLTEQTPLAGFVFSVFVWAPTVILYAAGQFHLTDLISRAKWKMLNEVQTKIEALYGEEGIPSKDTLDRLAKLMDYHDRIKATPNSALNFRSSLNFLNSLLFPVLAFIIANLDRVIELLGNMGNSASP